VERRKPLSRLSSPGFIFFGIQRGQGKEETENLVEKSVFTDFLLYTLKTHMKRGRFGGSLLGGGYEVGKKSLLSLFSPRAL